MLLRVSDDCLEGKKVLANIVPALIEKYASSQLGELQIPCEILDERFVHILVPAYIEATLLGVKALEIAVDPGAARCGIALAIGERVVEAFTLPQEMLRDLITALSRHFKVRMYLGRGGALENVPIEKVSEVVCVDESYLPPVKIEDETLRDHARDALRILVKGRLQSAREELQRVVKKLTESETYNSGF